MATTRWDDIEKTIIGYLNTNWTSTSIAWPNVDFDPTGKAVWIQVHVLPTDAYQMTVTGSNIGQMHKGYLHINLFAQNNTGTGTIKGYVDDLCDLFNHVSITISGTDKVQFFVPVPKVFGPDGEWWREIVRTEFEYLD